jgi:uncharacterized membrane protein YoaK (UPF0700 family)
MLELRMIINIFYIVVSTILLQYSIKNNLQTNEINKINLCSTILAVSLLFIITFTKEFDSIIVIAIVYFINFNFLSVVEKLNSTKSK